MMTRGPNLPRRAIALLTDHCKHKLLRTTEHDCRVVSWCGLVLLLGTVGTHPQLLVL